MWGTLIAVFGEALPDSYICVGTVSPTYAQVGTGVERDEIREIASTWYPDPVDEIEFRIRNLEDGKTGIASFASLDDAKAWLAERPPMIEVQGVDTELEPEVEKALHAAMRPLDDAERERKDALFQEQLAAVKARNAEEQRQAVAEGRADTGRYGPDDPMVIEFVRGRGLRVLDPMDHREIPEVARTAVEAWIAERDTWLHPRRQHVGAAQVIVRPGSVSDESERIQPGGQFTALPGLPDE